MEINIKVSCMYCGRKEKVFIQGDGISPYMNVMNAKWGNICCSCKKKMKEIAKSKRLMSDRELYNKIKELSYDKGLMCNLFNRKMNLGKKDKEKCKSIKYVHIVDPMVDPIKIESKPIVSIYYDEDCVLGSTLGYVPYYEVYYCGDVERFTQGEEGKILDCITEYINKYIEKQKVGCQYDNNK